MDISPEIQLKPLYLLRFRSNHCAATDARRRPPMLPRDSLRVQPTLGSTRANQPSPSDDRLQRETDPEEHPLHCGHSEIRTARIIIRKVGRTHASDGIHSSVRSRPIDHGANNSRAAWVPVEFGATVTNKK